MRLLVKTFEYNFNGREDMEHAIRGVIEHVMRAMGRIILRNHILANIHGKT